MEYKTSHLKKRQEEDKKGITLFIKNTIRLLCKSAAVKTTLPIIALIISFFVNLHILSSPLHYVGMCFHFDVVKKTHKTNKEGDKGWEGGSRGVRWPPHIEYFPVDFAEGFSAAWLKKQQHANEWRTSVIIYQTKDGGL